MLNSLQQICDEFSRATGVFARVEHAAHTASVSVIMMENDRIIRGNLSRTALLDYKTAKDSLYYILEMLHNKLTLNYTTRITFKDGTEEIIRFKSSASKPTRVLKLHHKTRNIRGFILDYNVQANVLGDTIFCHYTESTPTNYYLGEEMAVTDYEVIKND